MRHKHLLLCCTLSLLLLQACFFTKISIGAAVDTAKPIAATAEPSTPQAQTQTPAPGVAPTPLSVLVSAGDLAAYFAGYANATMLLSDGISQVAHNYSFSTQRRWPNSTFKILHSLIALEEGVVSIDDSLRRWDGTLYSRPELNQDQDLASAMKYSCVWYYKQLARKIGATAMQNHLNKVGYGNMDISGGIDKFWLVSSLLVSAQEQLDFIIRLYYNGLPFSPDNMEYVKSILRQEGYPIDLYGKTGSSGEGDGWFIGYALLNGKPYFFATYIEGKDASGSLARDKTAKILNDLLSAPRPKT